MVSSRSRRREAGLTLLELMIVVTIIAVVAAAAAPTIGASFGERRSNETALDIVRLARRGRSEAVGYGRAYLLRFDAGGNGAFELYRGDSNRCNNANWPAVIAGGCTAGNLACRDFVVANHRSTAGQQIVISSEDGASIDFCFEPTGRVLWQRGGGGLFSDRSVGDAAMGGGGMRFQIVRNGGDGVTRRVIVPLGGDARVLL
jgi:prepilin-type N-terminal cleavage/methylation domain-containing protein